MHNMIKNIKLNQTLTQGKITCKTLMCNNLFFYYQKKKAK